LVVTFDSEIIPEIIKDIHEFAYNSSFNELHRVFLRFIAATWHNDNNEEKKKKLIDKYNI